MADSGLCETLYSKNSALIACTLGEAALREALTATLSDMLAWEKMSMIPQSSQYYSWKKSFDREQFERQYEQYPFPKTP